MLSGNLSCLIALQIQGLSLHLPMRLSQYPQLHSLRIYQMSRTRKKTRKFVRVLRRSKTKIKYRRTCLSSIRKTAIDNEVILFGNQRHISTKRLGAFDPGFHEPPLIKPCCKEMKQVEESVHQSHCFLQPSDTLAKQINCKETRRKPQNILNYACS